VVKLTQHILSTYKEAGRKWLDNLPSIISKISAYWNLRDLSIYENLSWHYVAKGFQNHTPIVLKVGCNLLDLQREVSALRSFGAGSCVKVLAFSEEYGAILLDQAQPGMPLKEQISDSSESTKIACDVALTLVKNQKKTTFPFDTVPDLLKNLDQSWSLPQEWIFLARKLKEELLICSLSPHLIHGDLHRENILSHGESWVAIDPKGYIGTLYNEVWPFIHEPEIEIPLAAKHLNLDEGKLTKWCFVHAILAATWCLEDGVDPKKIAGLASKIFSMVPA